MAELLMRHSESRNKVRMDDQVGCMVTEITNTVLGLVKLEELPREVRLFEQGVYQPNFHVRISFLESEISQELLEQVKNECFKILQKYAYTSQRFFIVVVREKGLMEEGGGCLR